MKKILIQHNQLKLIITLYLFTPHETSKSNTQFLFHFLNPFQSIGELILTNLKKKMVCISLSLKKDFSSSLFRFLKLCSKEENNWNIKGLYTTNLGSFFKENKFSIIYSENYKLNSLIKKKTLQEDIKRRKSLGNL